MNKLKQYLIENIDDNIKINPCDSSVAIPLYLKNEYNFFEMMILDHTCLLIEIIDELPGIEVLHKHLSRIKELSHYKKVVLYVKDISRYRRKSLIENRIPFVMWNGQMYMPFLGLDLSKVNDIKQENFKLFSTTTQLTYLYFLYNNVALNTTELAEKANISVMTASRSLNHLYKNKLLTYEVSGMTGRSKIYKKISDPEYFLKGSKYIKTPIKKVVYVECIPEDSCIAGLEALARLSMLNNPKHFVRAMSITKFDSAKLITIDNRDVIKDKKLVELELWDYDPSIFSENKYVDIMSLYASLKDDKDERVEQALEAVLQGEKWYMG